MKRFVAVAVAAVTVGLVAAWTVQAAEEEHEHGEKHKHADQEKKEVTVTGEVLDMACYLDHGASGPKHADCAKTCISSGLPVGIKGNDGKTYLIIGEHKPMNAQLAEYAAKTITVRGKAVSRDGFNMIENAEIVTGGGSSAATPSAQYVCTMCNVTSDKPGKCPKCGMTLVLKQ